MKKFTFILCGILSLTIAGCAGKKVEMTKTGFLADYEQLHKDPEREGVLIYKNTAGDFKDRYTKVKIMPVEFMLGSHEEGKELTGKDKQEIADSFHQALEKEFSGHMEIVDTAEKNTLLLRTAVTDLEANTVLLNLHWSTTMSGAGIGGASIEAELVDSVSGERVLAFVDARKGKRLNYAKGLSKWGHSEDVLGQWAREIVINVRQLKGEDVKIFVRPEPEFSKP